MRTRNKYLTLASERILKAMQNKEYDSDGELTYERGAGWMVGFKKVDSSACKHLLMLCLLRLEDICSRVGVYEIYTLSSEVSKVLEDPQYVPEIMKGFK